MSLAALWLPILLSAIFVFLVSSVVHMLLPIHKSDYKKLPQEEDLMKRLREASLSPGEYAMPRPDSMKDMGTPEMVAKYDAGPVATLIVLPNGLPNMGKSLIQWFLFSIVISIFAAYVASVGLAAGAPTNDVLRLTATAAFLGYGVSHATHSIWKGLPWSTSFKYVFDGLLYSLATGAAFAWMWPAA